MSDRKLPPKPRDYPVARGVAPPPGRRRTSVPAPRRPAVPPPLPAAAVQTPTPSEFAFADTDGKVVLRRPRRPPSKAHRGWILVIEIGAVLVLAGFFMAAGWVFLGHRAPTESRPAVASRDRERPVDLPGEREKTPEAPAVPAVNVKSAAPFPAPIARAPGSPAPAAAPGSPPDPPPMKPSPSPAPPPNAQSHVTNLTFQRDIFPILKAKCISCHGENKKKLKGGLDVSTVALLEKGGDGGPAIDRKNPEASPLWETVASGQMPPGKSSKLTESEKKKLHDWIVGGGK